MHLSFRPLLRSLANKCAIGRWLAAVVVGLVFVAGPARAQNTHYVWNNSDLIGAINDANNRNDGTSIIFRQSFAITSYIPGITGRMTIDGAGFTLDANRNQFYCGNGNPISVTIRNLSIVNAGDIGGAGGDGAHSNGDFGVDAANGGGGGAGMGGAVFVADRANVVLESVSITGALARGGNGGNAGGSVNYPVLQEGGRGGGRNGGAKGQVGGDGGAGGFGGGGGGAGGGSVFFNVVRAPSGGAGGYGGGGGGSARRRGDSPPAPGGWGGGRGGQSRDVAPIYVGPGSAGGGGAGLGGGIFVQRGGELTLKGSLTISGNAAVGGLTPDPSDIDGGRHGIGAGSGIFHQGGSTIFFDSEASQTVTDVIADEAGTLGGGIVHVVKTGGGTLTLGGAQAYVGETTVVRGRLNLAGTLRGGLNSTGGILAPQGHVGAAGHFHQAPNGTLLVRLSGAGDRLTVGGASIEGMVAVNLESAPVPGDYTVLHAPGGLTGTFANLPPGVVTRTNGMRVTATYAATTVVLSVRPDTPWLGVEHPLGTPVAAGAGVSFGVAAPQSPATRTFFLRNRSSVPLTISSLNSNSPEFVHGPISHVLIAPGTTASFDVTFIPAGPGARSGVISVGSDDPATPLYQFTVSGTQLVPTYNAATNAGLRLVLGAGPVDLAALTGATPPGGVFSGAGVSGGFFDPGSASQGLHTITYTVSGASSTFTVNNGSGLVLDQTGGDFAPGNLAPGGVAFAKDVLPGYAAHAIAHLNDGRHGNAHSWINNSADSFAGVSLGATAVAINRIAFGRDNTGEYADRCADLYTLQYTTVPNPSAATTTWVTLGQVDLRPGTSLPSPGMRQLLSFPTVLATGVRILTPVSGTAIDEIEIYPAQGVSTTGGLALLQEGGTLAPGNLARAPGATVFGKDQLGGVHQIAKVTDGVFGNASSWIGASGFSFVGVAFGRAATFEQLAFGRDNTGGFSDRATGRYLVQVTSVANPGAATPDADWTTLGTIRYEAIAGPGFTAPALRHRFGFSAVTATGLRIVTVENGLAIDELEVISGPMPQLTVTGPGGVVAPGAGVNVSVSPAEAFSAQRTLTVTNTGTASLTLGTLAVAGLDAGSFTLSTPALSSLAPGQATSFTVTVALGGVGSTRVCALRLPSNDPDTPLREVPLSFTVLPNAAPSFTLPAGDPFVLSVPTINPFSQPGFLTGIAPGPAWESAQTVSFRVTTDRPGFFATPPAIAPNGTLNFACSGIVGSATVTVVAQDDGGTIGGGVNLSTPRSFVVIFAPQTDGPFTILEVGGTSAPGNLAPASRLLVHDFDYIYPAMPFPSLKDGVYGTASSFRSGDLYPHSPSSAHIYVLLDKRTTLDRIALSSDNLGLAIGADVNQWDIYYTDVDNPTAEQFGIWEWLGGLVFYDDNTRVYGAPNTPLPLLRRLYRFPPITATALLLIPSNVGSTGLQVDEVEVYAAPTALESWRLNAFGRTTGTGPAADVADPDGDGLPNLVEYALDLDPHAAAGAGERLATVVAEGRLTLDFHRARPELTYEVQASDNLVTWTTIATNPGAVGARATVADPVPLGETPRRFLRLRVTSAAAP